MYLNVDAAFKDRASTALASIIQYANTNQNWASRKEDPAGSLLHSLGPAFKQEHGYRCGKARKLLACGGAHTLISTTDGCTLASGRNAEGQLGLSDNTHRTTLDVIPAVAESPVVKVACGMKHSIVGLADGRAWAFGLNTFGQLGVGDLINKNAPTMIPLKHGASLVDVACGANHSLLCLADGSVMAFGADNFGQLGLRNYTKQHTPTPILLAPKIVVVNVACGDVHSMLRLADGRVMTFGRNSDGQLGLGNQETSCAPTFIRFPSNIPPVVEIACGASHSLLRLTDGRVMAFGRNEFGQLGLGDNQNRLTPTFIPLPPGASVVELACGANHSMLRLADGRVLTFGSNEYDQLGLENEPNMFIPTFIPLNTGSSVVEIASGYYHSLLRFANGYVAAFGRNIDGRLGVGDINNRIVPHPIKRPPNII